MKKFILIFAVVLVSGCSSFLSDYTNLSISYDEIDKNSNIESKVIDDKIYYRSKDPEAIYGVYYVEDTKESLSKVEKDGDKEEKDKESEENKRDFFLHVSRDGKNWLFMDKVRFFIQDSRKEVFIDFYSERFKGLVRQEDVGITADTVSESYFVPLDISQVNELNKFLRSNSSEIFVSFYGKDPYQTETRPITRKEKEDLIRIMTRYFNGKTEVTLVEDKKDLSTDNNGDIYYELSPIETLK